MTGLTRVVATGAILPAQCLVSLRCRLECMGPPLNLLSGATVAVHCIGRSLQWQVSCPHRSSHQPLTSPPAFFMVTSSWTPLYPYYTVKSLEIPKEI